MWNSPNNSSNFAQEKKREEIFLSTGQGSKPRVHSCLFWMGRLNYLECRTTLRVHSCLFWMGRLNYLECRTTLRVHSCLFWMGRLNYLECRTTLRVHSCLFWMDRLNYLECRTKLEYYFTDVSFRVTVYCFPFLLETTALEVSSMLNFISVFHKKF